MEDSYVLQLQEPKFREFYLATAATHNAGRCIAMARHPVHII